MITQRENTKPVYVGKIKIGGGGVCIQSMCNTDTADIDKTLTQINELIDAGCDIVRLAINDMDAARSLRIIREKTTAALVADIHFDYRLALVCIENAVDKIRINPGNIGEKQKVMQVANACKSHNIPIRIGVNMGSIDKDTEQKFGKTPRAMVESALYHINLLNECDFDDIVISLKASDVVTTVKAYRMISERVKYPLHIGITEAGTAYSGIIKSSVGIGALLLDGIGDTIRVSLTDRPIEEVRAAKEILKATGIVKYGPELISCPTCGRCKIDIMGIAKQVEKVLEKTDKNIKVAVMGCVVNGPGEAKDADIGIAGGDGCAVLFKKGKVISKIKESEILSTLINQIERHGK
ncbi:MAG: flavodoxin-dependent (E)-4-hydroxy-3-methylbut-2-enyl-diphosphate synthase [Clostridiaceae bacterium]|nr:flavodoxin-dependent (E)-4-hydroxy-3-methylbut-2-enyl-diphosphate synthase [Clostridiaceae bacterium]